MNHFGNLFKGDVLLFWRDAACRPFVTATQFEEGEKKWILPTWKSFFIPTNEGLDLF